MADAVVIGAGPNGLVAANQLVDAGWDVVLLEANDAIGGAVRSSRDVADSYVHDTFSSFYPLAAVSPTIRALDLGSYGLEWSNPPAPVGNPLLSSGGWALVHPDPSDTAAALDAMTPGDGQAWLDLYADWERVGPAIIQALLTPFPPVRAGADLLRHILGGRAFKRLQLLLGPVQSVADARFRGDAAKLLLATNSQHADIPPTGWGSGLMGWLLVMIAQQYGYPVPRGGAGRLSQALADRFTARGGSIVCDARADRVVIRDGRAIAVRTADGEYAAKHAVLADVSAPALYGKLIPPEDLPRRAKERLRFFEWDPGTVKVDWALDSTIPWRDKPDLAPGTVHIADSVDELQRWAAQLAAGTVPDNPFLLMGQMTTADPSRSPVGTESVWAYTHVPQQIRADAGGTIRGKWDEAETEQIVDRIEARIEQYAPGFTSHITARRVLTPPELERRNANLVGGAVNGGTSALRQELVLRPMPGLGRAETVIKSLYLASASAHPGGGVHGACGSNAARAALFHAH